MSQTETLPKPLRGTQLRIYHVRGGIVQMIPQINGPQRPNLKSEDSGFRHRFSEAKVSLRMGENGTGHEEARGPTRRRLCCTPFQNFSQRERDVEECHRRAGQVGPEHLGVAVVVAASSAGHSGAASALWEHVHRHFAVAALFCRQTPRCTFSGKPLCRFRLTGAWRHHVSMLARQVGASLRRPQRSERYMRAFQSQAIARNPTVVHFGALWAPPP